MPATNYDKDDLIDSLQEQVKAWESLYNYQEQVIEMLRLQLTK